MDDGEFGLIYERSQRLKLGEDSRRPWEDAFKEIREKFEGKTFNLYYDVFLDADQVQLSFGTEGASAKYKLVTVGEKAMEFSDETGTKVTVRVNGSHKVNIYDTAKTGFKLSGGSVHIYFFET